MSTSTVRKYSEYPLMYDPKKIHFGQLTSDKDILGLFKVIFGRDFKEDIIEWYAACPTGSNIWYGAFEGDEPIGMYGLLPINIKVGGLIYHGALCNNVGVIPKFLGRGLFQSLGQYALGDANFPISVCLPNMQAARGHKIIGWELCGILELLSTNLEEKKVEYVEYDDFKFLPRQDKPYFHVVKDQDFLKWRYSRPYMQYFQSFFDGGHYAIWKNYEGRKQVLEISDFHLVQKLGGKVDILQFKDSPASDTLKESGFSPISSNEFLIHGNIDIGRNTSVFKFEPGDNDVF